MLLAQLRQIYWPIDPSADILRTARLRLLAVLSTALGALGCFTGAVSYPTTIEAYPVQTWVGLLGPLALLLAPFAMFWTGQLKLVGAAVITLVFGLILFPAVSMGGAANPVILYLTGLPILATFLIGYRAGIAAGALTIGSLVGLYVLRGALPGLPDGFDEALAAQWNTITLSILIVAISLFVVIFHREMARANRELDTARMAANAGSAAKSEFVANMSHEIRTPMNGILGMAALLQNSELNDAQRSQVEIIERSGEMLLALLNDVLDLAKIEAGELQIESIPFSLRRVLNNLAGLHGLMAEAKGLIFHLDIPAEMGDEYIGDPLRLNQILNNLLSNAVKFTQEGSVTLSARQNADGLVFTVKDSGVGIDPAELERLFQPFTQADVSTTRRHGGTGLGLPICRKLSRLLGGTIEVESFPDEGSAFILRLPFPPAEPARAAA